MHIILNIDGLAITRKITDWHRFVGHITGIDLVHTRVIIQHLNNNEQFRIEYIMGEKTREQLATTLVRNDGTRKKLVELLNLYELLSVVGIESFAFLVNVNLKENGEVLAMYQGKAEHAKVDKWLVMSGSCADISVYEPMKVSEEIEADLDYCFQQVKK